MTHLFNTLGNLAWMREHEAKLRELLPETWTHAEKLNALKLGFELKMLGVDWRSPEEFTRVLFFLERVGIMQRNEYLLRRNPERTFNP